MLTKTHHRCPRCGETKPRTSEHFYFNWAGQVTGYCKICHADWNRAYTAAHLPDRRRSARDYLRRKRGTPPERYRQRTAEGPAGPSAREEAS
jgi:hypothetical protein